MYVKGATFSFESKYNPSDYDKQIIKITLYSSDSAEHNLVIFSKNTTTLKSLNVIYNFSINK